MSDRATDDITSAFTELVQEAALISQDVADRVADALQIGREQPLDVGEAQRLLTKVVEVLADSVEARGDTARARDLSEQVDALVARVMAVRASWGRPTPKREVTFPLLDEYNGIVPEAVRPRPIFHGRAVPMRTGYVRTMDLKLWGQNERLEIHLEQFRDEHGREPNPDETLDIMLSKLPIRGIPAKEAQDQFAIVELARSIAVNDVQKKPIVDIDGTLLDGNRRVAACRHILMSSEFTPEQKERASYIYVQQLTEDAGPKDRRAVIVALNFEPDCKLQWPEYVKARKIYQRWQEILTFEARSLDRREEAILKRELSMQFGLGPETNTVNRYLRMIEWARRFEDYHVVDQNRDEHEVRHTANHYIQYFDELSKGVREGGVAWTLNQHDAFRGVVFNLLLDGKFRNWKQIRDLKHVATNEDARQLLRKAANEPDRDEAMEMVEDATSIARTSRAEQRVLGANTRIKSFVKWLEQLPARAFMPGEDGAIEPSNIKRLVRALKFVRMHTAAADEVK